MPLNKSILISPDPAFIVMEYISGGDLLTFLRKRRPENAKKKQALLAGDATFGGCCTSMKDSTKGKL